MAFFVLKHRLYVVLLQLGLRAPPVTTWLMHEVTEYFWKHYSHWAFPFLTENRKGRMIDFRGSFLSPEQFMAPLFAPIAFGALYA